MEKTKSKQTNKTDSAEQVVRGNQSHAAGNWNLMTSELTGDGRQIRRSGEFLDFVLSQVKRFKWGGEFSLGGEDIQTLPALPFCCLDVAGCRRWQEGWESILLQDPEILRLFYYQDQGHKEACLPST